jgi:hypothetical protein
VPVVGFTVSRFFALPITKLFVKRLTCPDCGNSVSTVDVFECQCGYRSQRSRNILDQCRFCKAWATHVPCPSCESSVVVWGKPMRRKR